MHTVFSLVQKLTCNKMHIQLSAKIDMRQNAWKIVFILFFIFTFNLPFISKKENCGYFSSN